MKKVIVLTHIISKVWVSSEERIEFSSFFADYDVFVGKDGYSLQSGRTFATIENLGLFFAHEYYGTEYETTDKGDYLVFGQVNVRLIWCKEISKNEANCLKKLGII